ncbi:MAG: dihydrodipicolinate reductase [Gammaproteobacteria bacterium]|nr:dihydrodipicolinate reductase [Gammaproteobacteria bacterium]
MSYKVFQWASGTVGRHAASAVLERDNLELVGLHAVSPGKIGEDVGGILGVGPVGLTATGDVAAVLGSDADVVVHAPLASLVYGENPDQDVEDICRILASGKNVITVVGYMYPKVYGPALVERLEAACSEGSSSFHSTGMNPGWMGDLMPLTMSAMSRTIERIHVLEISNFQFYPSPEIMFEAMGFGSDPDAFERSGERRRNWLNGLFRESVQMVADGIGLELDDVRTEMSVELAPQDLQTAAGVIKKGTVAGQHWEWAGVTGSDKRVIHETVWRMHESVAPNWATGTHTVTIEGSPRMHVAFEPDYVSDGLLGTAMHAVNAIPYVCDAEPGIKTFLDLPWIMGRGAS